MGQTVADERAAAAGSLVLDWTLQLDDATVADNLKVERLVTGLGWLPMTADEVAVGSRPTGGISSGEASAEILVLARNGWQRGTSYRVRLTSDLKDELGRRFGRTESLEWRIPEAPASGEIPAVVFDRKIPTRYES